MRQNPPTEADIKLTIPRYVSKDGLTARPKAIATRPHHDMIDDRTPKRTGVREPLERFSSSSLGVGSPLG